MKAEGRHDEALTYAANAVQECPGNDKLLAWEARLVAGDHDPMFACHPFLFDRDSAEGASGQSAGQATGDEGGEGGDPAEETRGASDGETPHEPSETEVPPKQ